MPNLNSVHLIGNVIRDPEIKFTPKGTAIAAFGIAINRSYKTESGEKREETTFIDLEAYARLAEIIGEYCKKGRPIFVEGRLKMDQWEDKQTGQKRSKMKVFVEQMQLLGGKEGAAAAPGGKAVNPPPRPAKHESDPDIDAEDSDLPF